jgi:hypothetical protein
MDKFLAGQCTSLPQPFSAWTYCWGEVGYQALPLSQSNTWIESVLLYCCADDGGGDSGADFLKASSKAAANGAADQSKKPAQASTTPARQVCKQLWRVYQDH